MVVALQGLGLDGKRGLDMALDSHFNSICWGSRPETMGRKIRLVSCLHRCRWQLGSFAARCLSSGTKSIHLLRLKAEACSQRQMREDAVERRISGTPSYTQVRDLAAGDIARLFRDGAVPHSIQQSQSHQWLLMT